MALGFLTPSSPFDPPLLLHTILTQPSKTLIRLLDFLFSLIRPRPKPGLPSIRVVCISDTHCLKAPIPNGDLLIHAGDLAVAGSPAELQAQIDWLNSLPHEHKVAIAGNHDTYLDPRSRVTLAAKDRDENVIWRDIHYLQHTPARLKFQNGRLMNIYGAPQIPACGGDDFAFQYPRGSDAWTDTVPNETDVLVTHTPPKYHLDLPAALGCEHLMREVGRVQPLLHVFGHVHAGKSDFMGRLKGGQEVVRWDEGQQCLQRAVRRSNGLLRGLFDPRSWLDVVKVLMNGVAGVLWDRVWCGASPPSTIMVNASLMYNDSGKLLNPPQVVEI